jgi:hypothetical protein
MGAKHGYIILILFYIGARAYCQTDLNFQSVDSITYKYYTSGDWSNLISFGNKAIESGIDYKYLRQRLGYAYFMTGDFVRAYRNFEKALQYDSYDAFTLAYLYYINLDLVKPETSGYYASRMSVSDRKSYNVNSSKAVENIDLELSLKVPSTTLRSNPLYLRFGLGSRPWPRLGLYQSISAFNQYITVRYPSQIIEYSNRQYEYYGIIKYALLPKFQIKAGYHFLYTDYSSLITYTNLSYFGMTTDIGLFNINLDGSLSDNSKETVIQGSLKAGFLIPGRANFRLTSGVSLVNQNNSTEIIYNNRIGFRLNQRIWMEGDVEWGNMNNYNDYDALYIYNSVDPMTFKSGLTTYFLTRDRITIWINLGTERKNYYETDLYNYKQFSFLGGLRWRL